MLRKHSLCVCVAMRWPLSSRTRTGRTVVHFPPFGLPEEGIIDACIANGRKATNESLGFQTLGFPKRIILDASVNKGFTLVELLVVVAIIGVLIGLLLPAVQAAREAARRMQCTNHVRQSVQGLHMYASAVGVFPSACIVTTGRHPVWDPWAEASDASNGVGKHGTSWMLMILPYIEHGPIYDHWDFEQSVACNSELAQIGIAIYHCPTRRSGVRAGDEKFLLMPNWTGGGNDYGGCLGAGNGFKNTFEDGSRGHRFSDEQIVSRRWYYRKRAGIFAPNRSTQFSDIRDGASNTIMIGELQRLQGERDQQKSEDGWAVGGASTLFTTAMTEGGNAVYQTGGINNGFFEAAGSDHPGGANFGMADGSARFISENIRSETLYYLGSMADGEVVQLGD